MSLVCTNITFAYNGTRVLHQVSLDVPKGSFCALLGRNGSGKTTLLHCLCGILHPESEEIMVDNNPVHLVNGTARAKCISLVPQESDQIFPFTVLDLVLMGRNPHLSGFAMPGAEDEKTAWQALELLGAAHLAKRRVNQISGGERQLATVARALAQQAPVMLLDEPTNHLDFHNQYHLLYQIRKLCRDQNLTVLASMHNPNAVAAVADRVVLLEAGHAVAQGDAESVLTQKQLSRLYGMPLVESRLTGGQKHFMPVMEFRR
ncbi:iron complex transport system ATP-binding protein [Desulfosalsimonas propionicica]|uniref:Iron complex transport system ATP-binding protein n=1 Tax=Desulfosalsimonas propionicica TaxID=332175 RepID=A0A7W0CCD0_9BACT|nr:ABC transporter ATP-binding protein [Desulfosalsimonas propionicica]MBA2883133.1 iron complex transport system ATP-binding protein [Desulfosalsimonas propionicica]